jgi:hypothetical protein
MGDVQMSALEIYVFDPAHDEDPFPGEMMGRTLLVKAEDVDAAAMWLVDAANSADDDGDTELRAALSHIKDRLRSTAASRSSAR